MSSTLSLLHPEVHRRVLRLLAAARAEGLRTTVTSTRRTRAEQTRLYQAWLDRGQTGLPAAPPGTSTHEYGVAVDIVSSDQQRLAHLAECAGLHWAGQGDHVHFDVFGPEAWREWLQGQAVVVPPYHC